MQATVCYTLEHSAAPKQHCNTNLSATTRYHLSCSSALLLADSMSNGNSTGVLPAPRFHTNLTRRFSNSSDKNFDYKKTPYH